MAEQVQRVQLGDEPTHRQTDRLRRQGNELAEVSILQGRIVEATLPNATSVTIKHALGRQAEGALLIGLRGASAAGYILEVARSSTSITLQANSYGATITARFWVF